MGAKNSKNDKPQDQLHSTIFNKSRNYESNNYLFYMPKIF